MDSKVNSLPLQHHQNLNPHQQNHNHNLQQHHHPQLQYQQQQQNQQQEPQPHAPKPVDAPPKQVAMAIDRLSEAARLIADVRIGCDRLYEALLLVAQHPHMRSKHSQLLLNEDSYMRQHFHDLRLLGKQLEETGVITESLRSRSNSWGLHMPVVCPDGAVVAYAWKRQLAGQAGASAVDRTRLALKAFTDQKKRFFPHIDDDSHSAEPASKKPSCALAQMSQEEISDYKTLTDIITSLEKQMPNFKIFTYERLDWLKRASSLPASANENRVETSKKHAFQTLSALRTGLQQSVVTHDKAAVIEVFYPAVFRCLVSLHPAGSIDPDAVAFFSPDEGGSHVHARGSSVHQVFKQITEHAGNALEYFIGIKADTALYSLLHWICSYQTLFSRVCSKCGKLLAKDTRSSLLLPPVYRSYQNFTPTKASSTQQIPSTKDQNLDVTEAYHTGCFSDDL